LIFARGFQGWSGPGRNNIELHHEYSNVTEIHWRPENRADCRLNENGDLEAIVSVTNRGDKGSTMLGLRLRIFMSTYPICGVSMPRASCAKGAELLADPYAGR
jgi:hypothetical protein